MELSSPTDFRRAAKHRLPPFLFHYVDGAAQEEITSRRNGEDLAALPLRQRVLRDVSQIDLSANLFGRACQLPVGLGPVGLAGMLARRGEVQAARAAFDHGVPFCLSTVSLCSIEEVAGATSKPLWFQLYVIRDRGFMRELLSRAAAAGCTTLVFTVDMPVPGVRYRDAKSGLSGRHAGWRRAWQAVTHPSWAWDVGLRGRPHNLGNLAAVLGESSGMEDYMGWLGRNFDPTVTWADLGWIRENWAGQLIIKGILDPGDAREAVRLQADGIVVSNHGGRQLDGVISTAAALPEIAEAVQRDLTILVDGGVRSGSDVVKLLCLGAQGVLLGRAWAFALAACGGIGVGRLLAGLSAQMRTTMALAGATRIDQLDGTFLQYGRSSSPEGGADRFTRRSR